MPEFPFGDDQLRVLQAQQVTGTHQPRIAGIVGRVMCSVWQSVIPGVSSPLATQRPNCGRTVPKLDLLTLLGLAFERKAGSPTCWKHWKLEVDDGVLGDHSNSLGAGGRRFESSRPDHFQQFSDRQFRNRIRTASKSQRRE